MNVEIIGGPKDGQHIELPDDATHLTIAIPEQPIDLTSQPGHAGITIRTMDLPICHTHPHKAPHLHWRESP